MAWLDNYSDKGAICPHCGYLSNPNDDSWELYSEDTAEWTCASCGKDFLVSVYTSYSWTTGKKEEA